MERNGVVSRRGVCLISALVVLCYVMVPTGVARGSLGAAPVSEVDPGAIVVDHADNLWFTEDRGIERMTTTGTFRLFAVPGLSGYYDQATPGSLAVGAGGAIWFTSGARIGRVAPSGKITLFYVPAALGVPEGLTRGPEGTLWCVLDRQTSKGQISTLARVSSGGTVTPLVKWPKTWQAPVFKGRINGLTVGPGGRLWFTATHVTNQTQGSGPSFVGYVDPRTHVVIRFPLPRAVLGICSWDTCIPTTVAVGAHRDIWFGMFDRGIGRMTPTGKVHIYPLPLGVIAPTTLALGPDGGMWFGTIGEWIGRIGRRGALTFRLVSRKRLDIYDGVTFDAAHMLWFTADCINSVGRLDPAGKVTLFHIPGTAKDAGQECPVLP